MKILFVILMLLGLAIVILIFHTWAMSEGAMTGIISSLSNIRGAAPEQVAALEMMAYQQEIQMRTSRNRLVVSGLLISGLGLVGAVFIRPKEILVQQARAPYVAQSAPSGDA